MTIPDSYFERTPPTPQENAAYEAWRDAGCPPDATGDSEDLTATELWGNACRTCQEPDGKPNTEYLNENGQCTFGCGAVIDNDSRMCLNCLDHSANVVECQDCSARWENWNTWECAA